MITRTVPENAFIIFRDGNQWCATYSDFINLQESIAGFGDTPNDAIINLQDKKIEELNKEIQTLGMK